LNQWLGQQLGQAPAGTAAPAPAGPKSLAKTAVPSAADINRAASAAPAAVAQVAAAAAPVASSGVWDAIAANTASTVTKLEAIRLLLERGGGGSSQPRYRR
jgi:hypothetical protein